MSFPNNMRLRSIGALRSLSFSVMMTSLCYSHVGANTDGDDPAYCSWHKGSRNEHDFENDPNGRGFEAEQPWCDVKDGWSCTPFYYRPYVTNNIEKFYNDGNDPDWCTSDEIVTLAGNSFQTTKAWRAFDEGGTAVGDHFWLFHGCDGAGIMEDCVGDVKFVEKLGAALASGDDPGAQILCYDLETDDTFPMSEIDAKRPDNARVQCNYKHPGLNTIYDKAMIGTNYFWYVQGGQSIWEAVCSDDPDNCEGYFGSAASGGGDQELLDLLNGLTNPFDGPAFLAALYPWVCGIVDADGNDGTGAAFNQEGVPNVKCWWDNEPEGDGKTPFVEVYFFRFKDDGEGLDMYGYQLEWGTWNGINDKSNPRMDPLPDCNPCNLYPCNNNECPWTQPGGRRLNESDPRKAQSSLFV
jgi:hypothetical protein